MDKYAFNALCYFKEKGEMDNVDFVEDFNGKTYCGIDDKLYCGKWMLYYESCDDATFGVRVNPDLMDSDRAADNVIYSAEMKSKVYLWELNPPSKKCINCKEYLRTHK